MLVKGKMIEVMEFENLKEFLKTQASHYLLKYTLNTEEAIYYAIVPCITCDIIAFCKDKNYKSDYIKYNDGLITPCNDTTGPTIGLANIVNDTLLKDMLEEYYKPKKK